MGSFGALGSLEASLEEPVPADVAAWRSMMAVHGFCLPSMQPGASWGAVASSGGSYRQQREELHPMFELLLL
ncbi:hypothetical protein HYH03_003375 [Edaphochlamys debaryana]|uniref:Uncharacterized protein n=1 Tax=Edaphochlamys debaryana TaxID=47281 RepID=A0A836C486_9CHLO|nr:hypothetical protein HYH03_003375 [Edaphochlamys debaryana]|eukprot:KAG2498628.1 hypothetical protein HYH03_003375 [Edaphochlamys debaryana]